MSAILLSTLLSGGDALVLRDQVTVKERYVRLTRLVDVSRLSEEARGRLSDVYLGRAPAAGTSRSITAGEIRNELAWRGLETSFVVEGSEVVVGEGAPEAPASRPGVRKGDVVRAVSSAYEADARALEDGLVGREIALEIVASKSRLRGRVAAAGRIEVIEEVRR